MDSYIKLLVSVAINNKYTKTYIRIIMSAINRDIQGYYENHHIVPKSFNIGGENDSHNIVKLTAKEHYIVHLIMTKMFVGEYRQKMVYAFRGFVGSSNEHQSLRYTSRIYDKLKSSIRLEKRIRVYKGITYKYVLSSDNEGLSRYLDSGWVFEMPDEYKVGRVGNMRGKHHSAETKHKMSKSSHKTRPPLTLEHKKNISKSLTGVQKSEEHRKIMAEITKNMHIRGELNSKGENNPNYGRRKIVNHLGEYKYVKLNELDAYISNGWKLAREKNR